MSHIKVVIDGKTLIDGEVEQLETKTNRNNIHCIADFNSPEKSRCVGVVPGSREFFNISFIKRTPKKQQLKYILEVFKGSLK